MIVQIAGVIGPLTVPDSGPWHGWLVAPRFSLDQVRRIIADLAALGMDPYADDDVEIDDEGVWIVEPVAVVGYDPDTEEVTPGPRARFLVPVDDDGLYLLGVARWIWEVVPG